MIPYVKNGTQHILTMQPYNAITLAMPGRHQNDTDPVGGDFVVMVDDETMNWVRHPFTHTDIFQDIESKVAERPEDASFLLSRYVDVVCNGDDPEKISFGDDVGFNNSMHPQTLLYALQCLAVAEHRRYARYETKGGGRYLPLRFAAGIVEGKWTATHAADKQKRGRVGVEWLEKDHGLPDTTKLLLENLRGRV